MLPATPRCDKARKQANKIAALSMMLCTNPSSSIPEGYEGISGAVYGVPFHLYLQGASVLSVQGVVCISCTVRSRTNAFTETLPS